MNPETHAYQYALVVWNSYLSQTRCSVYDEESPDCGVARETIFDRILRALPPVERTPTTIGLYLHASQNWSTARKTQFLDEFLPSPTPVVSGILKAAGNGDVIRPRRIPVTLEEFPSRIWHRALATRAPGRCVSAAFLAYRAMVRLIEEYDGIADLENARPFWISSGDLPCLLDLVALPPRDAYPIKNRILDRLIEKRAEEIFLPTCRDQSAMDAWMQSNHKDGPSLIQNLADETRETSGKRIKNGQLNHPYDTRRLGRMMFRLGRRHLSFQCANALGGSPWKMGWQFQVVSSEVHSRIRQAILKQHLDTDVWMTDPALACSAMTIPLWLVDGVARVAELTDLFNRAADCPWIFPRLQHIYQWHLAIAGNQAALREIEQLAPDLAAGLSDMPHEA